MARHSFKYQCEGISQYLIPTTLYQGGWWSTLQLDAGALTALFPGISVLVHRRVICKQKPEAL